MNTFFFSDQIPSLQIVLFIRSSYSSP